MKFGIREAVDVVFKVANKDGMLFGGELLPQGAPVLYFDTLKTSTTEGTATTVYAQGGAGNPRLIAWEGDKTITFTFEDALISPEGMAILTGAGLVEASALTKVRAHRKEVINYTVASAGAATIDLGAYNETTNPDGLGLLGTGESLYIPTGTNPDDVYIFVLEDGEISERITVENISTAGSVISVAGATAALPASTVVQLLVDFYVEKVSGVKEITIEANKFAGYFYIEGETLFRRQSDGADLPAQIIIPNAKVQTAFTFSMSPTGDPSTFTFTADAFPGFVKGSVTTNKVLYAIQLFEA